MPKLDQLKIEILDDGTIKVETDDLSGVNHLNAEQLLGFLARELGGETTRVRKNPTHIHQHGHLHQH